MRAIRRLVAYQLATGWRGWVVLVLLIGLAGGCGAHGRGGRPADRQRVPQVPGGVPGVRCRSSRQPARESAATTTRWPGCPARRPSRRFAGLQCTAGGTGREAEPAEPGRARRWTAGSAALLEVPKMLAGRQPRPGRPGEVMVDQIAAQDLHLRVGSRLALGCGRRIRAQARPAAVRARGRHHGEPRLGRRRNDPGQVPGHHGQHRAVPRARPPLPRLRRGVRETAARLPAAASAARHKRSRAGFPRTGGQVFVADEAVQAATVERSIRPQAVSLALFALILAVTACSSSARRQLAAAARGIVGQLAPSPRSG